MSRGSQASTLKRVLAFVFTHNAKEEFA